MIAARPAAQPAAAPALAAPAVPADTGSATAATPAPEKPQPPSVETPVPVFRPRIVPDGRTRAVHPIPAVIPLVRAPDDPGVSDDAEEGAFAEPPDPVPAQAGGFKGFLSRLGRR
jgi:HemY protein